MQLAHSQPGRHFQVSLLRQMGVVKSHLLPNLTFLVGEIFGNTTAVFSVLYEKVYYYRFRPMFYRQGVSPMACGRSRRQGHCNLA